jgi:hypothetical protein
MSKYIMNSIIRGLNSDNCLSLMVPSYRILLRFASVLNISCCLVGPFRGEILFISAALVARNKAFNFIYKASVYIYVYFRFYLQHIVFSKQ